MHKDDKVVYLHGSTSTNCLNNFLNSKTVFDSSSTSARQYLINSSLERILAALAISIGASTLNLYWTASSLAL